MHQVMEYHKHSYLVSLLFAAPFLLFIIFSKFFLLVAIKMDGRGGGGGISFIRKLTRKLNIMNLGLVHALLN